MAEDVNKCQSQKSGGVVGRFPAFWGVEKVVDVGLLVHFITFLARSLAVITVLLFDKKPLPRYCKGR